MKDAIGATWLMGIVLVFVVLFSGFLAFAINYSKAFKVKNEIINILERNMDYNPNEVSDNGTTANQIHKYLEDIGYDNDNKKGTCPSSIYGSNISTSSSNVEEGVKVENYCIKKISYENGETGVKTSTYKVTTFVMVEMPLIWQSFAIPVSGETKRIYE